MKRSLQTICALAIVLAAHVAVAATDPKITIVRLPDSESTPGEFSIAADGSVWFVDGGKLAHIDQQNRLVEYSLGDTPVAPHSPVVGPDGNIWFSLWSPAGIVRMSPDGLHLDFFAAPDPLGRPRALVVALDGAIWFVQDRSRYLGRIDAAGHVSQYETSGCYQCPAMRATPDGLLWFVDFTNSRISAFDVNEKRLVVDLSRPSSTPTTVTLDEEGNAWVPLQDEHAILRVTRDGVAESFPIAYRPRCCSGGPQSAHPVGDGVWWSDAYRTVGFMDAAGVSSEFPITDEEESLISGTAVGSDGALWLLASPFVWEGPRVARVTREGAMTTWPIDVGRVTRGLVKGAGNTLWGFAPGAVIRIDVSPGRQRNRPVRRP
jgi:streptogramin lyase